MPDLVDECLERLEGGDEHVQPQVELVAVHQQRRLDVPLSDHLRSQTHHPDRHTDRQTDPGTTGQDCLICV